MHTDRNVCQKHLRLMQNNGLSTMAAKEKVDHLSSIDMNRMSIFQSEIYRLKTVGAEKRSNTEQVVLDWLMAEVAQLESRRKKY